MSTRRAVRTLLLAFVVAVPAAACTEAARQDAVQAVVPAGTRTITARNVEFEPTTVAMEAGVPLRLLLQNEDAGIPHNIVVRGGGTDIGKTEIVTGVARTELSFGPLPPGVYEFACEVHPNMTGTITVGQ
jgi:plastocyanin